MGNNRNSPPLQKSNTKLHKYTGNKLNAWGTVELNIDCQGHSYIACLFGFWHINFCGLFNTKCIFIQINSSISNNSV